MIPKIIHYCWVGEKPYTKLVEKCIASWKQHLPDYEFRLWDKKNSPMNVPFVREAYEAGKYAFVADYVRLWALYNEGGLYLDSDVFVIKSMDDLLKNECFVGYGDARNAHIDFCVMGAVAHNDCIKKLLDKYENLHFSVANISDYIIPRLLTPTFKTFDKSLATIYPHDYFYPFPYEEKENVRNFMKYATENTYAVHLWNVGWGTWQAKLRDRVFYYLRKLRGK